MGLSVKIAAGIVQLSLASSTLPAAQNYSGELDSKDINDMQRQLFEQLDSKDTLRPEDVTKFLVYTAGISSSLGLLCFFAVLPKEERNSLTR